LAEGKDLDDFYIRMYMFFFVYLKQSRTMKTDQQRKKERKTDNQITRKQR